MSETCRICNATKQEQILFTHIGASSPGELISHEAAAAIVSWYLNANRGDLITFVGDYDDPESLPFYLTFSQLRDWPDRTDRIVRAMIDEDILEDHGKSYVDEEEPDVIYIRDLRLKR